MPPASASSSLVVSEPTVEAESLIQVLEFLDELLESETDNTETILEIKGVLEDWLKEMELE